MAPRTWIRRTCLWNAGGRQSSATGTTGAKNGRPHGAPPTLGWLAVAIGMRLGMGIGKTLTESVGQGPAGQPRVWRMTQCIGRETVGLRNAVPTPNSTLRPFGQETAAREALGHNPILGPCTGVTPEWRAASLAGDWSPRDRPEHPMVPDNHSNALRRTVATCWQRL